MYMFMVEMQGWVSAYVNLHTLQSGATTRGQGKGCFCLHHLHLVWLVLLRCCLDLQSQDPRNPEGCKVMTVSVALNGQHGRRPIRTWRDHYLFIEVEAYSNALPPQAARVPNIPSDAVLSSPAMLAGRRRFCDEQRRSQS